MLAKPPDLVCISKQIRFVTSGEVTQDKKTSRCHLPSVVYHQVKPYTKIEARVTSAKSRILVYISDTTVQ